MRALLLTAIAALVLVGTAQATNYKRLTFTANCGTCTASDWDATAQKYSFRTTVHDGSYQYFTLVPPDGHLHYFWLEKPAFPAGCWLVSRTVQYSYVNTTTFNMGLFSTNIKSCSSLRLSLPAPAFQMVRATAVGDGGGTGWMNGIQCTANHSGWVTWYQGRPYRCAYNPNYTIKWAWVLA